MSQKNRNVAQLIKTRTVEDIQEHLHSLQHQVEKWLQYWKEKQEEYFEVTFDTKSPAVLETNQVRRFFNQFLAAKLKNLESATVEEQQQVLTYILPFNTDGGIQDFLLHFFQLKEGENGQLEYELRDPFDKEARILYDIYKIKKTIECIDVMRRTLGKEAKQFPSVFSEEEKKKILEELREVLTVLIRYTIKPECRKELYATISPKYASGEAILERRESNLFYCYPHVIEKYDYRNLFFLIYFRDGLVTKVKGSPKQLRYDYLKFAILKQEYLTNWLNNKLKNNPAKQKVYEKYEVDGKTIAAWVKESPEKEIPLLKQIPANQFNNLVAQVDEQVDDSLKVDIPSMSESHGEMNQFKKGVKETKKFSKAPLEKLKSFFSRKKKEKPPIEKTKSVAETQPQRQEPEVEPTLEIKITPLQKKQIPFFYLCASASKYKAKLSLIKIKMGGEYVNLSRIATKLFHKFGENGVVKRRTPKHDWTIPYLFEYILGEQSTDYLFILGGEASVKAKGMGYSSGDEYSYTPYFVFAAAEPEEEFDPSIGERIVSGRKFLEYDVNNPKVRNKAVELMYLIEKKELKKS